MFLDESYGLVLIKIKDILLRLRNQALLGVEVRKNVVRWVQLSYSRGEYCLEAAGSKALSEECSIEDFKSLVRADMKLGGVAKSSLAVSVSHAVAGFENISLTKKISAKKREEYLQFCLAKKLELDPKDIIFDYQADDCGNGSNSMQDIKSVVIKRKYVLDQKAFFRGTCLVPKIIDVDLYAIERAVRLQMRDIPGVIVVINANESSVLIVVLNYKEIVYLHEYDAGPRYLKTHIQFIGELKKKMEAVGINFSKLTDRIVLGGDFIFGSDLLQEMNGCFDLPVIVADPLSCIKKSKSLNLEKVKKLSPSMLVSCGLALRVNPDVA